MDFKTKRRFKSLGKLYIILAWLVVSIFFGLIIVSLLDIANIITINIPQSFIYNLIYKSTWGIIIYITLIISGLTLAFIGGTYISLRTIYKSKIKEYRQRRFFYQILILVKENDLDKAIIVCDKLLYDGDRKDFLHGFLMNELLHSKHPDQVNRGENKLQKIIKDNNPENVKLYLK